MTETQISRLFHCHLQRHQICNDCSDYVSSRRSCCILHRTIQSQHWDTLISDEFQDFHLDFRLIIVVVHLADLNYGLDAGPLDFSRQWFSLSECVSGLQDHWSNLQEQVSLPHTLSMFKV